MTFIILFMEMFPTGNFYPLSLFLIATSYFYFKVYKKVAQKYGDSITMATIIEQILECHRLQVESQ